MKKQNTYNTLNRPTNGWTQNNSADTLRLTSYAIYGEQATTPKVNNLLGKLWQGYNESGKIESVAFDFKGNLLSKQQAVISSTVLKTALDSYQTYLVDWTGLPAILGTQLFETSSEFDALNRATKITLPENVNTDRKEIIPTYNRAGALEKVSYDSTEYVENIAYNAKGQRLLITFGNNIMTRYVYDNLTFRLLRQRSEKYVKTQTGNIISYTPQSGTNKQDDKYIYDLIGNIFNINIRTTACGVGGTDSLDRSFEYDPLYRLTSATGRENVSGGVYPFPGWNDTSRSTDPNTTEAYTRQYIFDKLGNVNQIKQLGTNGFTRDFSYVTGQNELDTVTIGTNNYNYTYDVCGNQLTENTTRQFEWDGTNRLISFKNQVGTSEPTVIAQYLYDSSGNRVKKIVRKQGGSYEIRTYIDGVFEYYTDEIDEQNTIYVMDASTSSAPSRVASIRIGASMGDSTPAIKYNLENNIYSSTVVLDDTGTLVNSQEYYPFGETSFGSYAKKRYQYVGKERDEESGLYYYGARYFSPWIARFISCDPLSAKYAQLSPYNYADNNPINDYDIDGMQTASSENSATSTPSTQTPAAKADATYVYKRPIVPIDQTPKSLTDKEALIISDNVYGGPDASALVNSWNKSKLQFPGVKFDDEKTGFQSALYERTNALGETEYVYAFAGTQDLKDVTEDANQALGLFSPQYNQAVKNARIISRALEGKKLTFVGHSLGGGLASAAALATGRSAITFNPAGLHDNTKAFNKLNMNAKIDAYIIKGEIVTESQKNIHLTAEGTKHYLDTRYILEIPFNNFDDIYRTYQRISNHSINSLMHKIK